MQNAITKRPDSAISSISDYQDLDLTQIETEMQVHSSASSNYLTLESGKKIAVRFLPGRADQKGIRTWYEHYFTNDKGEVAKCVCPAQNESDRRDKCAVCEREALMVSRAKTKLDQDAAYEFKAKARYHSNVISRQEPDKGVQIYVFPQGVMKSIIAIAKDEAAGGKFWDPVHGFDLIIERTGEQKKTKYSVLAARNTTPLSKDENQAAEWMDSRVDLSLLKQIPTYADTVAALTGRQSNEIDVTPHADDVAF